MADLCESCYFPYGILMSATSQYEFGRFRLDAGGRLLFCDQKRIQLTPKAVDVLLTLLENRGSPVSRHDLLLLAIRLPIAMHVLPNRSTRTVAFVNSRRNS